MGWGFDVIICCVGFNRLWSSCLHFMDGKWCYLGAWFKVWVGDFVVNRFVVRVFVVCGWFVRGHHWSDLLMHNRWFSYHLLHYIRRPNSIRTILLHNRSLTILSTWLIKYLRSGWSF